MCVCTCEIIPAILGEAQTCDGKAIVKLYLLLPPFNKKPKHMEFGEILTGAPSIPLSHVQHTHTHRYTKTPQCFGIHWSRRANLSRCRLECAVAKDDQSTTSPRWNSGNTWGREKPLFGRGKSPEPPAIASEAYEFALCPVSPNYRLNQVSPSKTPNRRLVH